MVSEYSSFFIYHSMPLNICLKIDAFAGCLAVLACLKWAKRYQINQPVAKILTSIASIPLEWDPG